MCVYEISWKYVHSAKRVITTSDTPFPGLLNQQKRYILNQTVETLTNVQAIYLSDIGHRDMFNLLFFHT